jgi:hypothetical protein
METISIVPVSVNDVEKLQAISRVTFLQTFAAHNNEADMDTYLNSSFSIDKLRNQINNTKSEFYFAQDGEMIVGYLKINTGDAQTEQKCINAFEIERIYVDSAY